MANLAVKQDLSIEKEATKRLTEFNDYCQKVREQAEYYGETGLSASLIGLERKVFNLARILTETGCYRDKKVTKEIAAIAIDWGVWQVKKLAEQYDLFYLSWDYATLMKKTVSPEKLEIFIKILNYAKGNSVSFVQIRTHCLIRSRKIKQIYCQDLNRIVDDSKGLLKQHIKVLFEEMAECGLVEIDRYELKITPKKGLNLPGV